jgi:hypothetical protein
MLFVYLLILASNCAKTNLRQLSKIHYMAGNSGGRMLA